LLRRSKPKNLSLSDLADALGWFYQTGWSQQGRLVERNMRKLASGKLVVKKRDHYELTKKASARPSAHAVSQTTNTS